jgi:hypothetical protein
LRLASSGRLRLGASRLASTAETRPRRECTTPTMPQTVPYSIAAASLIADQLERLATQHVHQLAGQSSNLEFWIAEAAHAIAVLDGYPKRFRNLHDAQVSWVRSHATVVTVHCPQCRGPCEFGPVTPSAPKRTPSEEIAAATDGVRRASSRFLLRLFHASLLSEGELRAHVDALGIFLEPEDLARPSDN